MRFDNSMPRPDEVLRGLLAESSLGTDAAVALRGRAALRDVRDVLRRSAALGSEPAADPGTVPERWLAVAAEIERRQRELRPFLQDARAVGGGHEATADEVDRLLREVGDRARAAAGPDGPARDRHTPGVPGPADAGEAADEPCPAPAGDGDFTDVVHRLDRLTRRGRRRLSADALTRAYVAAGARLLVRRRLAAGNTGAEPDPATWLAPAAVLRELRNGAPYLPRRGSEESLRRRWRHHTEYVADVLGYLEWVAGAAPASAGTRTADWLRQLSAGRDPLTGLLDRAGFLAADRPVGGGLVLAGVDGIGRINGALGLDAGDAALRAAARRIAALAQDGEPVGRVAGTVFAVATASPVEPRVAEFAGALAEPVHLSGYRLPLVPTIGTATGSVAAAELLRRGEVARYRARRTGTGSCRYDERLDEGALAGITLDADVRRTVADRALEPLVQPVFDLATGAAIGLHVGLRHADPERGRLAGDELDGVVSRAGLVRPFTRYLLDAALAVLAQRGEYRRELPVTVDLPPGALADRELPAALAVLLERHRVPGHRLVVPVSAPDRAQPGDIQAQPGDIGAQPGDIEDVLHALRALDVQLAASSAAGDLPLSLVGRLPLDELRLGTAFVAAATTTTQAATVLRYVADFGRTQGMRVVATGVLSAGQADLLARLGCTAARGGYFGPALPVGQALAALQRLARDPVPGQPRDTSAAVVDLSRRTKVRAV